MSNFSQENQPNPQNVVVNVSTPPQSQALPAIVSFFLPGIGQLIQGRVQVWLIWWGTMAVGTLGNVLLAFTLIGIPFAAAFGLCLNIANVCDAAWFDPMTDNPHFKKVMIFAWCIVAASYLFLILFVVVLGGAAAMSSSGSM